MPTYKVTMRTSMNMKNGTKLEDVEVVGTVHTLIDRQYGADTDGNRGERLEWVEDVRFDEAIATISKLAFENRDMEEFIVEGQPLEEHWIDTVSIRQAVKDLEACWVDGGNGVEELD
jgi:hypothetical protein